MGHYFLSKQKAGNRRAGPFPALLFLPLLVISCAGSPGTKQSGEKYQYRQIIEEREILLSPGGGPESPRMNIRIILPDFAQPLGRTNRALETLARELLYEGRSAGEYGKKLIAEKTEDYLSMRKAPAGSHDWEYVEEIGPVNSGSPLLVYARTREYYVGGAHGMREKQFFVIDPDKKTAVPLENLIRPDAMPALREQVAAALRRIAGLEEGAPLSEGGFFEDTVEPPDNFFPAPEGLVLHWDPYEIAPYAVGPVDAFIPWHEVRSLLSPRYQSFYPR